VSDSWSPEEVAATVASYCEMLEFERRGESFNEAEYNQNLRQLLHDRSKGAVELKYAKVSALMIELGFPDIDGYKPPGNYQASLREEIVQQWDARPVPAVLASHAVSAAAPVRDDAFVPIDNFVPAPVRLSDRSSGRVQGARDFDRSIQWFSVQGVRELDHSTTLTP